MRRASFVASFPVLAAACAAALWPATPMAAPVRTTAFWSPIHATVLLVDRRRKTVTIRHEALETVPAGVRVCAVRDSKTLARLRSGELIEARAETSHAQWLLDSVRVLGHSNSSSFEQHRMAALRLGGFAA